MSIVSSLTAQLAQAIADQVSEKIRLDIPDDWTIVNETRRHGKHAGKKFKNYYSPEGVHFRSLIKVREYLKFQTAGLPFGWKRVKKYNKPLVFVGPGNLEYDHIYQVYEYEANKHKSVSEPEDPEPESEPESEPEPKEPEPEPEPEPGLETRMTSQSYFVHAVCGIEPEEHDELWSCYKDFLEFISTVLCTDFNIGTDIVKLRSDICISSDMMKVFGKLVKRLSKFGGKLRFRIKKNRRTKGYHVKDAIDLFKRVTDTMFPRSGGYNMFVLTKPQKICDGVINGKRKQLYAYTFLWKGIKENVARYSIPRECVMKSIRNKCF